MDLNADIDNLHLRSTDSCLSIQQNKKIRSSESETKSAVWFTRKIKLTF